MYRVIHLVAEFGLLKSLKSLRNLYIHDISTKFVNQMGRTMYFSIR